MQPNPHEIRLGLASSLQISRVSSRNEDHPPTSDHFGLRPESRRRAGLIEEWLGQSMPRLRPICSMVVWKMIMRILMLFCTPAINEWIGLVEERIERRYEGIWLRKELDQLTGRADWIQVTDVLAPNGDNSCRLQTNWYSVESADGGDAVFQSGVENTSDRKSGLVVICWSALRKIMYWYRQIGRRSIHWWAEASRGGGAGNEKNTKDSPAHSKLPQNGIRLAVGAKAYFGTRINEGW
jgi:hypothetical protein